MGPGAARPAVHPRVPRGAGTLLTALLAGIALAQSGRYAMDHNHPDLRWYTLRTEHFDIHYPVSRRDPAHPRYLTGEGTARRLAAMADDTWDRLAAELGSWPNERVHVVVLEQEDDLVGFTFPGQDWIVFSGNPGPELHRMRGRVEWGTDLLAHELAHVFTLKRAAWLSEPAEGYGVELGGLAEDGANQIGASVTVQTGEPYWWSEGAAEFWSERIGVNWWTPSRDMTLRASAADGRLLDRVEWATASLLDDWYDPERAYQQGYAFHRWLAERHGLAAVRALADRSGERFRLRWEAVLEEVTGEDLATLKAAFEHDLAERVRAFEAARRAQGLAEGRELALWELGWQSTDPRTADRWTLKDKDERQEERERTGTHNLHASYSPDGRWFARHRSGWVEVRSVDEGMWTVFAEGVPDWSLTRAQRDRDARLSMWAPSRYGSDLDFVPGQDALVMVATEDEVERGPAPTTTRWTRIYRLDLAPRTEKVAHRGARVDRPTLEGVEPRSRMTPIPGTERAMDPSVSPDGEWLAYTRYSDGTTNLWVSRLDGTERRPLTRFDDGTWVQGTDWSPDGRRVVAAVHRDHIQDLWAFDAQDGTAERLTEDRWEEIDPHWAADGAIWFSADVDGVFDIFRRDPGGRVHRMTRVLTGAQAPALTPDGNLLYTRYTAFGFKTYGIPASELLWEDATDRFGRPGPEGERLPPPDPPIARRYRPTRAVLGAVFGPMIRLDRATDGAVLPRLGGWLRLRDAVEEHGLAAHGWLGADAFGSLSWTWHRAWPDLSLSASHWVGRLPGADERRQLTAASVDVALPWRDGLTFDLGATWFLAREERSERFLAAHRTRMVTAGITAGDAWDLQNSNTRTGSAHTAVLTRGDSALGPGGPSGRYAWHRAEWIAHVVTDAPVGARDGHRLVFDAAAGATDRPVALDDALRVGGDHPYALRPGVVQATIGMPGYAPFAVAGQHVAIAGLGWRLPLARAARQELGPLVVDEVFAQFGGHAGVVVSGSRAPWLADGAAALRVRAALFGGPFDSTFGFAWGARTVEDQGGPRFTAGFGTGF